MPKSTIKSELFCSKMNTRRFKSVVRHSDSIRPVQTNCPVDDFFHILLHKKNILYP